MAALPAPLLARFTLAGVAVYVAIDVLLAFLRPGYSLIYNAESDYGRGAWYWVMDLNFLLRCALSVTLVGALAGAPTAAPDGDHTRALSPALHRDGRTRSGLALLLAWAICSGLLAFFADDLEGQPQHGSGVVHLVLAFVAFTCMAIGAIVISASLLSEPAWRGWAPALLAISIAGAIAYLILGAVIKHHHAPDGLYERIFLGLELLWMSLAALRVARWAAATRAG